LENNFYVYVCLDPRVFGDFAYDSYRFDYEPFYVGKGQGYRHKEFFSCRRSIAFRNKAKKIDRESDGVISLKIFKGNESACFVIEKKLIRLIGRRDLETGPLLNFTDGGWWIF